MKLQLSNIQKSFGAKTVLAGANFQVRDNEKIALVGRNGCGKTTLMKTICGLEHYDSGSRMVLMVQILGIWHRLLLWTKKRQCMKNF